ncbi:MAG: 2-oxoacid:ferredoxin oxidoreductase subunit beta [Deltaproteobacteria bacterium RIFCSPLOWO2_12_FULL_40_28]|nr:MAG: 2-oxoacid:ferredoxin oxidoreductase subunit beta [Deltaproteobacteria bacterium RIFCSPHIGHO2_02_FULL_40_28]OGQ19562.1 MAG: 2-oxoacid:ferredoxin oxidoreductase subunit beta [Deltaproteobacteria bacterium RIFCSPHIGHO2_12_FULL_40_32]OGQ40839.1 MAG: 2-oxoacid:ferredoxin oxidoreductase subunit beta [Deltaproteobacteria bacterium RIFCSPLOWO2_02_FULL_40_36]OGQ53954.1 MAG: 2-oxoacid:ferredoxin oxidoreductase subunit beta [Deltaproteobacteria bacterium RIFCSPLOWO2_12_FULL_40_28]
MGEETQTSGKLTRKDFVTSQEVRWCPGCGDYAILAFMQRVLPELGIAREKMVFVSGIGCSSRFPYYVNTYGLHTIHGRAPAIATGIKSTNPDLQVWVVTGDGDGLSIGGNHLIHTLRRNVDLKILLFNNKIYGLTKGQYSPTSEAGKKTKSSPDGSIDYPLNPLSLALGAEASFVARSVDSNPKHLSEILLHAAKHKGSAFVEIFQNCMVFNDNAFTAVTDKETREDTSLFLEHGKPLIFGKNKDKAIRLNGLNPEIFTLKSEEDKKQALIHNAKDPNPAYPFLLSRFESLGLPVPLGVFRSIHKPTYDQLLSNQSKEAQKKKADLNSLLRGNASWSI